MAGDDAVAGHDGARVVVDDDVFEADVFERVGDKFGVVRSEVRVFVEGAVAGDDEGVGEDVAADLDV